ncbi:MAG: cytochrome P450 [Acidimicrobiia bacterium]
MTSSGPEGGIDLGCPASVVDPAGYFGPWLEAGDVHRSGAQRGWAVIGHAAVADVFRDAEGVSADRVTTLERVARSRPAAFGAVVEVLSSWMIFRDPPEHTRLRAPVRGAFTNRRVAALAPLVDEIADQAVDELLACADDGVADLTAHVARPVPALVIGALLGVEPEDRPRLQGWSDQLAAIVFSLTPSAPLPAGVVEAAEAFRAFFGELTASARPGDGSLVGDIIAIDPGFDRAELVSMATMLLFAGHETTTSLIQNLSATLLERPELERRVRHAPELHAPFVEEVLRTQGPARTMVRKALRPQELGGHEVAEGDVLYLSIAAANHDPRVFEEPATFDPAREPNHHLSFGWGLHHCLGARLARAETVAVLRRLLDRLPALRPAGDVPPLQGATMGFHRGPVRLAV